MSRLRHREPTDFLRDLVVNGHYRSFCKPGCLAEAIGMHTLVEHPLSKPGGLLEESFQYCRGPASCVRTPILKLVGKTWREKPMYFARTVPNSSGARNLHLPPILPYGADAYRSPKETRHGAKETRSGASLRRPAPGCLFGGYTSSTGLSGWGVNPARGLRSHNP